MLPDSGSYQADKRVAELTGLPYSEGMKLILKISYNIGADTSLVLLAPRQRQAQRSGSFRPRRTFARHGLQRLEAADGDTELFAVLQVLHSAVERFLRAAKHLRRQRSPRRRVGG
jgi:hypothetical protein